LRTRLQKRRKLSRGIAGYKTDIIIKNEKRENVRTDRYGNTRGQKFHAKGKGKEVKVQEIMYRGTTNVEHETYDYTGNK